jgi:hypothetical protein
MMMNGGIFLASYGFSGGGLGDLFAQWESAGIFQYALPFLLIFAVVFGLLTKINLFGTKAGPNKGVNAIISLAVAFMALQFNIVSVFFSEIFPRFGIAISVILVILILGGLFMPTNKESNWFMVALAIIVFLVVGIVIYNSMRALGWGLGGGGGLSYVWYNYGPVIIFAAIVIAVLLITMTKKDPGRPRYSSMFSRGLGEED